MMVVEGEVLSGNGVERVSDDVSTPLIMLSGVDRCDLCMSIPNYA